MPLLNYEKAIKDAVATYAAVYGLVNAEAELKTCAGIQVELAKSAARQAAFAINSGNVPSREIIGRRTAVR